MFANRFAKKGADVENTVYSLNPYFRLRFVGSEGNRVAVAVVNNGVVLSDSPADYWALYLVMNRKRANILSFSLNTSAGIIFDVPWDFAFAVRESQSKQLPLRIASST